jgi:DedD protein
MMPTEAYRELRHFLLIRLALGAGVLIVVGAVAVTRVPGAARVSAPPAASSGDIGPAVTKHTPPMRDSAAIGATPPSMSPRDLFAKPQLEEVMRPIATLEPLEGKDFEILPKAITAEAAVPSAEGVDAENKGSPPKLPKGPHLQAGIFAQSANAEEFRRKLAAEGYPAYVETRVHVGPYPSRKEAERVREKLKAQGTTTVYVPQ